MSLKYGKILALIVAVTAFQVFGILPPASGKERHDSRQEAKKSITLSVEDHFAHDNALKFKRQLAGFIAEALKNNPQLASAAKKVSAFKERPSYAYSLDDPRIRLGLLNFPTDPFLSDKFTNMTQKKISIMQKFPFFGKRGLRRDIASREMDITKEEYKDLERSLIEQIKKSTYELCFLTVAIQITKENKDLLKIFIKIAETKYATGTGIQHDVIKAQVELSKLIDEVITLKQKRETERAKLNTLMNRLPQAPLNFSHGIRKSDFKYTLEELQSLALENRPQLKGIARLVERYRASKKLAQKEYYPDFDVGISYSQRSGDESGSPEVKRPDFFSGFVTMNVPLWYKTKQERKVAEEGYNVGRAERLYDSVKNNIFFKIKEIYDKEKEKGKLLILFRTAIIPQARQSLNSALDAYTVDKVEFLTLLDAQIALQNWQIKEHRLLTEYEANLAELERVVGKELF